LSEVSRDEPLTISWDGTGPELIWLIVHDWEPGDAGWMGMTPNDGEHVLMPSDLAEFSEGAEVSIFLQRTRAQAITAAGFDPASRIVIETISSTRIVVR
jgi:hypothetical protein